MERMSDERLAELDDLLEGPNYKIYTHSRELIEAFKAERAEVERLRAENKDTWECCELLNNVCEDLPIWSADELPAYLKQAREHIDALQARAQAAEQEGERLRNRMAKLEGENRIKSEFLRSRQCPDHSGKWERGRCLQCEVERLREDIGAAAWIVEWMTTEKYRKPDIPRLVEDARKHYRETVARAQAAEQEVERLRAERQKDKEAFNTFYATLKKHGYETANDLVDRNIKLEALLKTLHCPDNAGGHHRFDGDGQCKDCCNYATNLMETILRERSK